MMQIRIFHKNAVIYLILFGISVIFMLPVIINAFSVMYGLPGDPYFKIWEIWYFKYAALHHKPFYVTDFLSAPFGANLTSIPYHLLWDKLLFAITFVTNEIFAYNFFIFLSFFLSGLTMYHLARHITNDKAVSMFSAFLYMFCPYHLARSIGHLELASIQWLPLFILCVLKLLEKETIKNSILVGLCLALIFLFNYYYGIFSYLVLFIFLCLIIVVNKVKVSARLILYFLIALLISVCIILPFIIPVYKNTIALTLQDPQLETRYTHPTNELFLGSARPLSYLLPSYMHPVFGKFTELFVGTPLYGDSRSENALYLGVFPLILSFLAIKRRTNAARIFFYLFIASIVLSMPPYIKIFALKIPLPQFFIYKISPIFRTFARFGVYAMLCVSVLAALGLKEIMGRISVKPKKYFFYSLSIIIILFEFLVNPLEYKTDLSATPEVYKWLAGQNGDFIICEYPLSKTFDMRTDWLIWQRVHQKRTVEGGFPGTYAEKFRKYILRLQDKDTPGILSWMGVKYVIIHLGDMEKSETLDIVGILPDFGKIEGLKPVKKFEDIEVYEITARPLAPDETAAKLVY